MVIVVMDILKIFIYTLIGGYFIANAVVRFKDREYFVFGVGVMLAIYEIMLIARELFVA